ncbi:MAG: TetR/AcrR family transcriptional regulator [Acidobacteria bacterium]|nr:TetR/AcrR family transcriptional regulator [Acidobacteriota bacterium]
MAKRKRRPRRAPNTPPLDSRTRILAAATAEFALRGFAATTVDRIAAHARLNKAMIYYHFSSKQHLYQIVLRTLFTSVGDVLVQIAHSPLAPDQKLDHFVATFVTEGTARHQLAPIILREIAEGGRRLDEETFTLMAHIVRVMGGIVDEGRASGQFEPVDPILLYLTTVWPIIVYLATSPIRSALARIGHFDVARLDAPRFIEHLQHINRRALMPCTANAPSPTGVSS